MTKPVDRAWVQQELNDLSDLIAGNGYIAFALTIALVEAKAIEANKLLAALDVVIDMLRLNKKEVEVIALEKFRDLLENIGPKWLTADGLSALNGVQFLGGQLPPEGDPGAG